MNPVWYFILSSLIAVIGLVFIIRKTIEKVNEQFDDRAKLQRNMFIQIAAMEIIPLTLIVFGFTQLEHYQERLTSNIPLLIILGTLAFGIFTLIQKYFSLGQISSEKKSHLLSLLFMGIMLIFSFPIIGIVVTQILATK
ncbi:hypothetical protein bcgnr5378_37230 [Bacillus cereus]|uniref:Uncharacterized protein n=1 Tax=Bacillus cereus TaxID=1396 RepID=A0A164QNG0_BACCE|nr:hypothetical protein [Bacillus cereus]KZD71946.1 hypothetical protein B4088_0407 [Bacillus cereus]HDR8324170.1 hypothetical protein [Bacillus cereus]HDR8328233.1 hypothetical protein [Bacillus cereus]HDR8337460.1 hypothetical protein [Bacillus cereus]